MQFYKNILVVCLLLCLYTNSYGQAVNQLMGDVTMPSPGAASLGAYGDIPVSYSTGVPNISIPIYTITEGPLSIPIALSYHSAGVRLAEPASNVGLGWNLFAGGRVTRTVAGIPDESPNGYMYVGDDVSVTTGDPNYNHYNIEDILGGNKDAEADIFSFNVNGIQGQFYIDVGGEVKLIPEQDIKIEYEFYQITTQNHGHGPRGGTNPITLDLFKSFTLTTTEGVKYIFGGLASETTQGEFAIERFSNRAEDDGRTVGSTPSGWFLRKIIDPNKTYEITLNYTPESYSYPTVPSKAFTYTKRDIGAGCGSTTEDLSGPMHEQEIYTQHLTSITSTKETVHFNYGIDREDINDIDTRNDLGGKALDEISITTGSFCKKYKLNYDYFQDHSTHATGMSEDLRLMLQSVNEESCDGSISLPPHQFDYFGKKHNGRIHLPNRFSKAIDHWGYFNGVYSNNDDEYNIPPTTITNANACGNTFEHTEGNANRDTNPDSLKLGILTKITYPTGGFNEFEFEANTKYDTVTYHHTNSILDFNREQNCGNTSNLTTSSFTIPSGDLNNSFITLAINNFCDLSGQALGYYISNASVQLYNVTDDQLECNTGLSGLQVGTNLSSLFPCIQEGKEYQFICDIDNLGFLVQITKEWDETLDENVPVGGLRIKSITTSDGENPDKNMVKQYSYELPSHLDVCSTCPEGQSSGVGIVEPDYAAHVNLYCPGNHESVTILYMDRSIVPLSSFGGTHITYSHVTERMEGAGKTVHVFETEPDPNETNSSNYGFPATPPRVNLERGFPKQQKIYHESGDQIANLSNSLVEDNYTYSDYEMVLLYPIPIYDPECPEEFVFATNSYQIRSKPVRVSRQAATVEGKTNITEYTYDNTYKNNVTSSISGVDANGNGYLDAAFEDIISTEYKYVNDGYGGTNLNGQESYIESLLLDKHMVGIPFEVSKKLNGVLIGGERQEYEVANYGVPAEDKVVFPINTFAVKGGNFVLTKRTSHWDDSGRTLGLKRPKIGATGIHSGADSTYFDPNYIELTWDNDQIIDVIKHLPGGKTQTKHHQYYSGTKLLQRVTDHNGIYNDYEYDALMRLDKKHISNGRMTTDYNYIFKLDANGNDTGGQNQVENITSYANEGLTTIADQIDRAFFDGLGRPTSMQKDNFAADGSHVTLSEKAYNNQGQVISETDLGKGTTSYIFENSPLGRVLQKNTPKGNTTFNYGVNDVLINTGCKSYFTNSLSKSEVIDVNGNTVITYNDFLGNTVRVQTYLTDATTGVVQNIITDYCYNDLQQLESVSPPSGDPYEYTYNDRGLMASKKVPGVTTPTYIYYDELERQVLDIDANGTETVSIYDALDRAIQTGIGASITPTSIDHYYTIGSLQAQTVTNQTVYAKDANNNPIDWIDYDETLNFATNNMLRSTYTNYDDIGRVGSVTKDNHIGGQEITEFTYNASGKVDQSVLFHNYNNSTGQGNTYTFQWTNTYDQHLRPKEVFVNNQISPLDRGQLISRLSYNEEGKLDRKSLHATNSTHTEFLQNIDYSYDESGRLIGINEIPTQSQTCANNITLCDQVVTVPAGNIMTFSNLFYQDGNSTNNIGSGMNFPYTINTSTDNGFTDDLKAWLSSNGYIVDDITYIISATGDLVISIQQTNFHPKELDNQMEDFYFNRVNCCGGGDPGDNYDLFSQRIIYPSSGTNIERVEWATLCGPVQAYDFAYDDLNRLTNATYQSKTAEATSWQASNSYNMNATYDLIGNIMTLNRRGVLMDANNNITNNNAVIDILNYSYSPNGGQLASVTETGMTSEGFGNSSSYTYDNNGNMLTDSGKGLTLTYNLFNLPQTVSRQTNSDQIQFDYLGNGGKTRKTVSANGNTLQKDYIGTVEYTDGQLDGVYHQDGRIRFDTNGEIIFDYMLKDYLGNTRVTFSDQNSDKVISRSDMLEEHHYYPFGMNMKGEWVAQQQPQIPYTYNGIEKCEDIGLNWNTALHRGLDPCLGRWMQIDPKGEAIYGMSPYQSMANNPVSFTDPDGDILPAILLGAAVGVVTNGINNSINGNNFFAGAGKAALFGGISGAVSFGIGSAATSIFGSGLSLGKAAFQMTAHGYAGGFMSAAQGGSFKSGFLSGAISSGMASGAAAGGVGNIGMIGIGGLSGGVGSLIGGGNFWDGVRQGLITSGLNHAAHSGMLGQGLAVSLVTGRMRHILGPDASAIGGAGDAAVGGGAHVAALRVRMNVGPQKGQWFTLGEAGLHVGLELGVSIGVTDYYYSGRTSSFTVNNLTGYGWSLAGSAGIPLGPDVGASVSYAKSGNHFVIGIGYSIGWGPLPVGGTFGYYETTLEKGQGIDGFMNTP